MKRQKPAKPSRPRKSLYFVDNPEMNELTLLEERKVSSQSEEKELRLHETAAPILPEQGKEIPLTAAVEAGPEHENLDGTRALQELLSEKAAPNQEQGIIYTDDIIDEAVTREKIAPFTIDASRIMRGTIDTAWIADYAVENIKLADRAVTSSKIAPSSVNGSHLVDGSIEGRTIRDHSIGGEKLVDGSITPEKLADRVITGEKLAEGAVESRHLSEWIVTADLLQDQAVTGDIRSAAEP